MRSVKAAVVLACCCSAVWGQVAWGQPVGQLLNATGRVSVRRAGGGAAPGVILLQLNAGDVVTVGAGGGAEAVFYKNGWRMGLGGRSVAVTGASGFSRRAGPAPRVLGSLGQRLAGRLAPGAALQPVKIGGIVIRGGNDEDPYHGPREPSPVGVIPAGPVTFRWTGPVEPGTQRLRFRVLHNDEVILREELPASAQSFVAPRGVLQPGGEYEWIVSAVGVNGAGKASRAGIRLLSAQETGELQALERDAAAAACKFPHDPASMALLGESYEALGMPKEARHAYEAALRLKPGDAALKGAVKRVSTLHRGNAKGRADGVAYSNNGVAGAQE